MGYSIELDVHSLDQTRTQYWDVNIVFNLEQMSLGDCIRKGKPLSLMYIFEFHGLLHLITFNVVSFFSLL